MNESVSNIKRKLKSISSTRKLSNAMALVATSKLSKQKKFLINNNSYADTYKKILDIALSLKTDYQETNPYLIQKDFENPLHIVITSNSGLCGSYNIEMIKYVESHISKEEEIFVIGTYGIKTLLADGYNVVRQFHDLNDFVPSRINSLVADVLLMYRTNKISSLNIFYTKYKNTLNYYPTSMKLLPIVYTGTKNEDVLLMEPSRDQLVAYLVPLYINSQIYACFLQSKTSEQVARINSMETAKQNADNYLEELSLAYNQARQANITQEMNEITMAISAEE